jgi:hypothetical protein
LRGLLAELRLGQQTLHSVAEFAGGDLFFAI